MSRIVLIYLIFNLCNCGNLKAQNTANPPEDSAMDIYRITQNMKWPNPITSEQFNIAILCNDTNQYHKLAQKLRPLKLKNRRVALSRVQAPEKLQGIQLLIILSPTNKNWLRNTFNTNTEMLIIGNQPEYCMVSIGTPFKTKTNHLLLGQRGFRTQKQPFLIKNHPIPTQTHSASNTERGWANTNQAAQTWQFLILGLSILLFILFKTHNKQNHNQVPTGQPAYEPDKVHPSQHQLANGIHVNYTKQGLKTWEFIAQFTNNNTEHLFVVRVESAHVIYPNERAELKRHTKQQLQSHTQSNPDDIFESLTQFIQPKQHKKQPPYTIGIARIDVQKTKPTSLHYATNGMLCQIITPTQSTQLPRSSEIRAYTNYNIFKIDLKPSTHLILGNPTKHQNPVLNKTSYINQ